MAAQVPAPMLVALLLALAWTAAAVAATIVALRRGQAARRAVEENSFLRALLAAAPIVAILVDDEGGLAGDERAAAWLGLDAVPARLADLAGDGYDPEAVAALAAAVRATLASAGPLSFLLPVPGGGTLHLAGAPAALPDARRAALLWMSDVSATEARLATLGGERDRLAEALDGLAGLISAAPFAIWRRDARHRLAHVNRAYVEAVEAESAEDAVRRDLALVEGARGPAPADGRRRVAAIVAGERRMLDVVERPIPGFGVAGFAIDVQALEDARADLARFADAQRAMLDRLMAGVAQFAADRTLTFYNLNFRRLFALAPEVLDEQPEFDRVLERMRESERAPESRDFRAWRADRRAWFNSAEAVEESWLLPGGTHLRVVAQPLPDGGLLLIVEDRTEHLRLASARDTLLQVRAATFDNLFEAIGVFSADGRLHLWNNRFRSLWGMAEGALSAHPHIDALAEAIRPRLVDGTQAALIREMVRGAAVDRQQRRGHAALADGRHLEFAAVPLPDGNALFALLDVTASHGMEEVLRSRNQALEETSAFRAGIVARLSYELRVPLTSIAGFSEMLAGGYAGALGAAARDYVEAIRRAVERLQELIGDSLDLSQGELGLLPIATEPLDVAELVRETARLSVESAAGGGVALKLDIAPLSGTVAGDRRRLRRCLDHLVRNALAHTPEDGSVTLRSRTAGQWAEITVTDTGIGIGEEALGRLLERPAGTIPEADGVRQARANHGVGLPLARQLVAAHGGTLRLDSEIGRGTSVVIHLPLVGEAGG